jgi:hypothetical protein
MPPVPPAAWDGDGKVHLVTGNLFLGEKHSTTTAVTLWKNLGAK